ncbi:uncharacterized protein TNIN_355401 [Trichonephila inaurata madagascariensis]|uniref:Uncharacterized protein n=1 Tax=Trichonephila inaurata madagascariensis TaxID=2747483 RepID=A0A8X6J3B2_9ARAC|nr:uncharacterized protein TNIN_355401 [Trichonephila inaurata madagascariensis]
MDNYLHAMLFAEDLVSYVLRKHGVEWEARNASTANHPLTNQSLRDRNRFRSEIGEAVFEISSENYQVIRESFHKMFQKEEISVDEFRYELTITCIMYLKKGYNEYYYLNLCALFIGVVRFYFIINFDFGSELASCVAQVLAYLVNLSIYKNMFDPFDDWFRLALASQCIRRKIAKDKRKNTTMDNHSEPVVQKNAL